MLDSATLSAHLKEAFKPEDWHTGIPLSPWPLDEEVARLHCEYLAERTMWRRLVETLKWWFYRRWQP